MTVKTEKKTATGRVSRGPQRWIRAVRNAVENPNSYGAKLLKSRLDVATQFDDDEIILRAWKKHDYSVGRRRTAFYTCSDFCAAMQMQLEEMVKNVADANELMVKTEHLDQRWSQDRVIFETTFPMHLSRTIRCFVCNRRVSRDGTTDDSDRTSFTPALERLFLKTENFFEEETMPAPAKDEPPLADWELLLLNPGKELVYIDDNGNLYEKPTRRVMMDQEKIKFLRALPPHFRVQYVHLHGE